MSHVLFKQTVQLAHFSMQNRYRNTWAGFVWVILMPLIHFSIQAYTFKFIVRIEHADYFSFLVSGLLPWVFITSSLDMSVNAFISQSFLFKTIVISPLAFVISVIIDNLMVLLVGLVVVTALLSLIQDVKLARIVLFIPASIPLFVAVVGGSIAAATYQVFFRDLRFVITFVLQGLYFLTPILYPIEFVPSQHQWLLKLNPVLYLIQPFRSAMFDDLGNYCYDLSLSFLVALGIALCGWWIWRRNSNEVILSV